MRISFFFQTRKKMFIRQSQKGRYFQNDDYLLKLIDFQRSLGSLFLHRRIKDSSKLCFAANSR